MGANRIMLSKIIQWKRWNWKQTKFLMRINYFLHKRQFDRLQAESKDRTLKWER